MNTQRGFVDVALDRPRKIRFTPNAVIEVQDRYRAHYGERKWFDDIVGELDDYYTLRLCLWAGLRGADPALLESLTEEETGQLIGDAPELPAVRIAVKHAALLMMNVSDEAIENFLTLAPEVQTVRERMRAVKLIGLDEDFRSGLRSALDSLSDPSDSDSANTGTTAPSEKSSDSPS